VTETAFMPTQTGTSLLFNENKNTPTIQQQFKASGVAQVIVVLKQAPVPSGAAGAVMRGTATAPATPDFSRLAAYFVSSPLTRDAALLEASAPRRGHAAASLGVTRASAGVPVPVQLYHNLGVLLGNVTPESLDSLRNENAVASITGAPELGLIRPRSVAEAKVKEQVTWGIMDLDVPQLWRQGLTGKRVVVAHLDTGADGKHPALKGAFANFAEFDLNGVPVTPAPKPHDTGEHGTHTAVTIAGREVKGVRMGVAPGAKLASAIVIELGNVVKRVIGGMDWALANGVKVLSMSLGLPGWVEDFLPLIQILRTKGVLPCIAVGNEGAGTSRSPGNYAESLSVGAYAADHTVAPFSSSQRFIRPRDPVVPDLVGPGVGVFSAIPGGKYARMDGTSMATPHIAGLAALLFEAKPTATVNEVEDAILNSCQLPDGMTPDRAGKGIPSAVRALNLLVPGSIPAGGLAAPGARAVKKAAIKPAATHRSERQPTRKTAGRSGRASATRKGSASKKGGGGPRREAAGKLPKGRK
jgi:subtilisin